MKCNTWFLLCVSSYLDRHGYKDFKLSFSEGVTIVKSTKRVGSIRSVFTASLGVDSELNCSVSYYEDGRGIFKTKKYI